MEKVVYTWTLGKPNSWPCVVGCRENDDGHTTIVDRAEATDACCCQLENCLVQDCPIRGHDFVYLDGELVSVVPGGQVFTLEY